MLTPNTLQGYVEAEPFRLQMASGRAFEVRHPEVIKILKSHALIFETPDDSSEFPEEWESVSLMLTESISFLEAPVR